MPLGSTTRVNAGCGGNIQAQRLYPVERAVFLGEITGTSPAAAPPAKCTRQVPPDSPGRLKPPRRTKRRHRR